MSVNPTTTTPTPTSNQESVFSRRAATGSRKRAYNRRGKVRAIIVRPEEMLALIRDTYTNAPVPADSQFFGISVNDTQNKIGLHFYSNANPNVTCVSFKPDFLLNILKGQSEGIIPRDAELIGVCVHDAFTLLRLDVVSDRFPAMDVQKIPVINMRYDYGDILISRPEATRNEYERHPLIK